MSAADRTFSFKAPSELTNRLAGAESAYASLEADPAIAAHISRELEIGLQRRLRDAAGRGGQGRLLRAVVEAFVDATEAAAREARLVNELRAFDGADTAGAAERAGLFTASPADGVPPD